MHVRQCTAADLPTYATVSAVAMYNDEMIQATSPHRERYYASYRRDFLLRTKLRFYSGQWLLLAFTDENDPDWDGTEKAMGYACYTTTLKNVQKPRPGGWLNGVEKWAMESTLKYIRWFGMAWANDQAATDRFRGVMANVTAFDHLGDHWELALLGTHPDYQRRGVGSALLNWGFERGVKDQVPVVLEATWQGEKLYSQRGFKALSKIRVVDDVDWTAMAWFPPESVDKSEVIPAKASNKSEMVP